MTVTNVHKDPERATMTLTSVFDASVAQVWQMWENPRLLERWWGPPTYPATFVDHDLTPGGSVTYYMTGPEGDQPRGWWRMISVDPPHRLEFEDGFADDEGNPNLDMPTMIVRVSIDDSGQPAGVTQMTVETTFASVEAMEQLAAMGMEEGAVAAANQIDELLRSGVASA